MRVRVVSAYVPLEVKHVTPERYHELAKGMCDSAQAATGCVPAIFRNSLHECWAYGLKDLPPAQPVPWDRYATPAHFSASNVVQHNRTDWAYRAMKDDPATDIWVWLDYGIMKQGEFTGHPVTGDVIREFLYRVGSYDPKYIHFPGIWDKGEISDSGDNWRFCGSTHIWPKRWLPAIDAAYKAELIMFTGRTATIPNDLPIWAHVEERYTPLPFKRYQANHDATQLSNYPENDHDSVVRARQKVRNG
jgi:hypothetical protein